MGKCLVVWVSAVSALAGLAGAATAAPGAYGPYNFDLPSGGAEYVRPLAGWDGAARVPAGGAWTIFAWVEPSEIEAGRSLIGGVGDASAGGRYLALEDGRPAVWTPSGEVAAAQALRPGAWRFLAAVSDGARVRLYIDGSLAADGPLPVAETPALVRLAPRKVAGTVNFAGRLAGFTAEPRGPVDRRGRGPLCEASGLLARRLRHQRAHLAGAGPGLGGAARGARPLDPAQEQGSALQARRQTAL